MSSFTAPTRLNWPPVHSHNELSENPGAIHFFQGALVVGYMYAYVLMRAGSVAIQVTTHLGLALIAVAVLPLRLNHVQAPNEADPVAWLVGQLTLTVGLPSVLLFGGAPLLQRWFSLAKHVRSADPFFLYAASNGGSLTALLLYPLLLEGIFPLETQSALWRVWFAVLWVLIATCAVYASSRRIPSDAQRSDDQTRPHALPLRGKAWRILLLSILPTFLMMGLTSHITTDIAALPLFWVIPLALYLLSFVIAFSRSAQKLRDAAYAVQIPFLIILAGAMTLTFPIPPIYLVPCHLAFFFVSCIVCNASLARMRPRAKQLGLYYLTLAIGGFVGGIVNVLIVPQITNAPVEYAWAIVAALALRPGQGTTESLWKLLLIPVLVFVVLFTFESLERSARVPSYVGMAAFIALAVLWGSMGSRPIQLALTFGSWIVVPTIANGDSDIIFSDRSFFGSYRVRDDGEFRALYSGTTLHGAQNKTPDRRAEPLTYYHRHGPLGAFFAALRKDSDRFLKVGVVGLGAGSVACYGRRGEEWTFFEIDPLVVKIAADTSLFTYLSGCGPKINVVVGDGRRELIHWPGEPFDLLLVDAFSSDAIPTHLLTKEAFAAFRQVVASSGAVLYHVSNRFLQMAPVVSAIAEEEGLASYFGGENPGRSVAYSSPSEWVAIPLDSVESPLSREIEGWERILRSRGGPAWTDGRSNVVNLLLRGR